MSAGFKFKISMTETDFIRETPKLLVNSLRRALREAMEFHQKNYMPKHFKDSKSKEYGYRSRNVKWDRYKNKVYYLRIKGNGRKYPWPQNLVWKGTLRDTILNGGYKTRGTVTARRVAGYLKWPNVPHYYVANRKRQIEPEVKAVSKREATEHAKRVDARTTELMKKNRVYYTRRRRVK